jgi:hypothetical protein
LAGTESEYQPPALRALILIFLPAYSLPFLSFDWL